jgi:flavin-binding protein dodecin
VELIGESHRDWQDAIENAVAQADKTIKNITGVEVQSMTADVDRGKIVDYKACVRIAFKVEGTDSQL